MTLSERAVFCRLPERSARDDRLQPFRLYLPHFYFPPSWGLCVEAEAFFWCYQAMAKRNDLKKRLKAADRRRNRRQAGQGSSVKTPPKQPQVRAADMIAELLVAYAREEKSPSDMVVSSALRACSCGDLPKKEPARSLALKIEGVSRQPGVTARAYRGAIKELAEAASLHQGSQKDSSDAFLAYLLILADAA